MSQKDTTDKFSPQRIPFRVRRKKSSEVCKVTRFSEVLGAYWIEDERRAYWLHRTFLEAEFDHTIL